MGDRAYRSRPVLAVRGWAIPCATDIALSAMVARVIFPATHPAVPFLHLLAIADDALGLAILALFYPSGPISLWALAGLMAAALLTAGETKMGAPLSFVAAPLALIVSRIVRMAAAQGSFERTNSLELTT